MGLPSLWSSLGACWRNCALVTPSRRTGSLEVGLNARWEPYITSPPCGPGTPTPTAYPRHLMEKPHITAPPRGAGTPSPHVPHAVCWGCPKRRRGPKLIPNLVSIPHYLYPVPSRSPSRPRSHRSLHPIPQLSRAETARSSPHAAAQPFRGKWRFSSSSLQCGAGKQNGGRIQQRGNNKDDVCSWGN